MPPASAVRSITWLRSRRKRKGVTVTCSVSIGPRDAGGFGLAVKLHVKDVSLSQTDLASLAQEAHEKICPYSHAPRGNVVVELTVEGG
jgi:lipoyl-dependent peroxiredoxin